MAAAPTAEEMAAKTMAAALLHQTYDAAIAGISPRDLAPKPPPRGTPRGGPARTFSPRGGGGGGGGGEGGEGEGGESGAGAGPVGRPSPRPLPPPVVVHGVKFSKSVPEAESLALAGLAPLPDLGYYRGQIFHSTEREASQAWHGDRYSTTASTR